MGTPLEDDDGEKSKEYLNAIEEIGNITVNR